MPRRSDLPGDQLQQGLIRNSKRPKNRSRVRHHVLQYQRALERRDKNSRHNRADTQEFGIDRIVCSVPEPSLMQPASKKVINMQRLMRSGGANNRKVGVPWL